jgi:hypothetical protein
MTGHQPDHHGHDDAALDNILDTAMNGILAKLEAAFDPGAGLADIYARNAATPYGPRPAFPAQAEPRRESTGSTRLEEACDQIDLLTAWLADLIRSGQRAPLGGSSYLELARDNLVQLRAGLGNRTMARPEAQRLTADISAQAGHADHILRSQHTTTLDHLASQSPSSSGDGTLTDQVRALREMVTRLYAPAGHDPSPVPAR